MATSPEFNEEQLKAARKPLWHQAGEPILTLEAANEWIEKFGLVAFSPGKLALTAPSLVEATLGEAKDSPSAADAQVARDLVARMTADGTALPLNLLGGGGDMPDFVVSGAAFKYIFTLRGDKSWKQAPATSGAVKVSPLGLRVFETLTEKGAMTAAELANELGREVTEAAIVRSLSELWQMLRVIPRLGVGDGTTLWELTNKRFTKAIKAGVNAGQPTALSALVSLYFAQTLAATNDEVETFLSPLAARSRIGEVLNALTQARELETVAVAGKTLLHISGELPEFAPEAVPEPVLDENGFPVVVKKPGREFSETETPEPGRIKTFAAKAAPRTREAGNVAFKRPAAGGFARKPREAGSTDRPKRAFGAGGGARPSRPAGAGGDRERRPFRKDAGAKPSFTKPWEEEKKPRATGAFAKYDTASEEKVDRATRRAEKFGEPFDGTRQASADAAKPKKPYTPREGGEYRKPFGEKKAFGEKKSFGDKKPFGAKRPYSPREGGEGRSFGGPKPFGAKRAFGAAKPFGERNGSFDRPKRPYTPRSAGEGGGFDRPKRAYTPRAAAGEGGSFDRPKRPYTPREGGAGDSPRPYRPRTAEGAGGRPSFGRKPAFGGKPAGGARSSFRAKPAAGGKKKPFGAGKLFDKKGPLPADGEGGLSPTGSKRKRRTEE